MSPSIWKSNVSVPVTEGHVYVRVVPATVGIVNLIAVPD